MGCATEGDRPRVTVQSLEALQGLATPWTVALLAELSTPWECGLGLHCRLGMGLSPEVVHFVLLT